MSARIVAVFAYVATWILIGIGVFHPLPLGLWVLLGVMAVLGSMLAWASIGTAKPGTATVKCKLCGTSGTTVPQPVRRGPPLI